MFGLSWKASLAFFCVCFFWGTTFLGIKVGLDHWPPFLFAGFRQAIAGTIFLLILAKSAPRLPTRQEFRFILFRSFLMLMCGNGLLTFAEQYLTSGFTAVIGATTPFWILFLNAVLGYRQQTGIQVWLGLLLGFGGTLMLCWENLKADPPEGFAWGLVALIIANGTWALGTVLSKNNKIELPPLYVSAWQMLFAGVGLTFTGTVLGEWPEVHFSQEGAAALAYLVVFGSIVGFGSYIYSIANIPLSTLSVYVYVNVIVAVLLGWLILNEPLNSLIWVAVLLTIGGTWLVNRATTAAKPDDKSS